ncbi:hypothetical protein HPB47_007249 [Ixodes persulcatus]|uniref:Uncharacterized protein n=1 Tax=Ixodes persulcatus TaxID=34615 RepID=A0AC60P827_IXOPE|nr:hypothetical protein HPB47_007249 [Ixodes persulcatus]
MRTAHLLQANEWQPPSQRRTVVSLRLLANLLMMEQPDEVLHGALCLSRSGALQPLVAMTERLDTMDRKRQALKAYASHVSKLCPKDWTANELHVELCNSTSPLTSKKVDLNRPCTGSETQFCHIYDELSLWNEVLCHCHMQIKEVAPKELAISAFHGRRLEPGTAAKARYALVLVHWLLKEHHCLRALRIQGSVILENSELLCDALRLAVGLKSLEIWGKHIIRKFDQPHQLVVEAMTANQTLQSLHITDEWSWFGHKNFPDIIKNNSGLLELALEGPISEKVQSFTEAIRVNKTMQKLSLNWSGVSVCDTKEFCSALAKNLSLQMVIMSNVDEKLVEELLAQFLASTKTLKCATLSFPTTESSTQSLLDGLLCNKSISKLELGYWCFKDRHAEDFAQVLRWNNTLTHLTLHHMSSLSILQELAKCIADNKFLLCINFDKMRFFTGKPWMVRIMDTLRRNLSLLQCAVYFVVGNHFKRCGEAFEQLFRSQTLLEKVQEFDSESESVAKERILNSKRHLDINFLAVAGVVKSTVACSRGNGSQVKLDEVGVDNWLLVRSYLKLTDIKNAPDEPCPPPSKRQKLDRACKRKL